MNAEDVLVSIEMVNGADLHQHAGREISTEKGWWHLLWADPDNNGELLRVRTAEGGTQYLVRDHDYQVRGDVRPDTSTLFNRWDNEPPLTVQHIETVLLACLSGGDMDGVVRCLYAMVRVNPHRAGLLLDTIKLGIAMRSTPQPEQEPT